MQLYRSFSERRCVGLVVAFEHWPRSLCGDRRLRSGESRFPPGLIYEGGVLLVPPCLEGFLLGSSLFLSTGTSISKFQVDQDREPGCMKTNQGWSPFFSRYCNVSRDCVPKIHTLACCTAAEFRAIGWVIIIWDLVFWWRHIPRPRRWSISVKFLWKGFNDNFTRSALFFIIEPSSSPSIIKASGNSSTTIYIEWSPIPQHLVHGILLGYHIHYSNSDPEGYGDVSTGSHPTGPANSSTFLKNLLKFTSYRIQVSAFTVKGDGPLSDAVIIRTEEDGKEQCLVDIMYLLTE